MNNKLILILITGILASFALGALFTRNFHISPPGKHHSEEFRGRPVMHPRGNPYGRDFCNPEFMRSRLELNEEQIKSVEKLNTRFDNEYSRFNKELMPLHNKLKDILSNPDPDMDRVRETMKQISDLELEVRILRISQGAEISKIIPPDKMEMLHHERRMMYRDKYHERKEKRLRTTE
jgi:hypothetical protein